MGKLVGINDLKNCEDLTLEEAKQFDSCKDLTDDEIKELLEVLKEFTEIAYAIYAKQKAKKKEEIQSEFKQAA